MRSLFSLSSQCQSYFRVYCDVYFLFLMKKNVKKYSKNLGLSVRKNTGLLMFTFRQ